MVQILGFSAPICFTGHFEEIGIAKVLVSEMSVFRRLRKCVERKKETKPSAEYRPNGLTLSLR